MYAIQNTLVVVRRVRAVRHSYAATCGTGWDSAWSTKHARMHHHDAEHSNERHDLRYMRCSNVGLSTYALDTCAPASAD